LEKNSTYLNKIFVGVLSLIGIVILVAGPLAIFSSLNPVAVDNKITGAYLEFNIEIGRTSEYGATNQYIIFQNHYVVHLEDLPPKTYSDLNLNENLLTRNYDHGLFQQIEMSANSDITWDIPPPKQQELHEILKTVISDINRTDYTIALNLYYIFYRPNPENTKEVESVIGKDLMDPNSKNRDVILNQLAEAINPNAECLGRDIKITISDFYIPTIRLTREVIPHTIDINELSTNITLTKK
jgi:hypothetical protein